MKKIAKKYYRSLLTVLIGSCLMHASAQESTLGVSVDAKQFFIDNEYYTLTDGYTLPGFRLTPTLYYQHNSLIRIEAGAYMLHYWGANNYPHATYWGLPTESDNNSHGVHCLPYLRASMTTKFGLTLVLGNLIGGSNHGLMLPLYDPELDFTADPEAGFQAIYKSNHFDIDAWVDWRRCIYYNSPDQENFYFGISANLRYNKPDSRWHFYSPLQAVVEHLGGEIDNNPAPIQTLINLGAGVGMRYNLGTKGLKNVGLEADFLASRQQNGDRWRLSNGTAWFVHANALFYGVRPTLGYYYNHNFSTLMGSPLWGFESVKNTDCSLKNPSTIFIGIDYDYEIAKGFSLGAFCRVYSLLSCNKYPSNTLSGEREKGTTSCSIGVSMKLCPSFVIKKFNQ